MKRMKKGLLHALHVLHGFYKNPIIKNNVPKGRHLRLSGLTHPEIFSHCFGLVLKKIPGRVRNFKMVCHECNRLVDSKKFEEYGYLNDIRIFF